MTLEKITSLDKKMLKEGFLKLDYVLTKDLQPGDNLKLDILEKGKIRYKLESDPESQENQSNTGQLKTLYVAKEDVDKLVNMYRRFREK